MPINTYSMIKPSFAGSVWNTLVRHMQTQVLRKHSAADQYSATIGWLLKFTAARKQKVKMLTSALIEDFHTYLDSQSGLHANSKKSYLSAFRAMYNRAVREKAVSDRHNPFAGFTVRGEKPVKRSITKKVIDEIANLDLSDSPHLQHAAELCIASFFACGIPFVDLVHLTPANLQDGFLSYNRRKTGTLVRIHVNSGLRKVMDDYQIPGSAYLFSVLSEGKDSYADYKTALRWYNTCLKEIGKRLSTPVRLTSYVIRHTWATEAYKQYIPVAVISQALGHTSEKTTRCYLGDLDQSELDRANALVTDSLSAIILNRA